MKRYCVTLIHEDEEQSLTYETEAEFPWHAFLKQPGNPNLKGPASYTTFHIEECTAAADEERNGVVSNAGLTIDGGDDTFIEDDEEILLPSAHPVIDFDTEYTGCPACDQAKHKIMHAYYRQMRDLDSWCEESLAVLAQDHADGKHIEEDATIADERVER